MSTDICSTCGCSEHSECTTCGCHYSTPSSFAAKLLIAREREIGRLEKIIKEINDIIAKFDYELNRDDDDIYGLEMDYVITLREIKEKCRI